MLLKDITGEKFGRLTALYRRKWSIERALELEQLIHG